MDNGRYIYVAPSGAVIEQMELRRWRSGSVENMSLRTHVEAEGAILAEGEVAEWSGYDGLVAHTVHYDVRTLSYNGFRGASYVRLPYPEGEWFPKTEVIAPAVGKVDGGTRLRRYRDGAVVTLYKGGRLVVYPLDDVEDRASALYEVDLPADYDGEEAVVERIPGTYGGHTQRL